MGSQYAGAPVYPSDFTIPDDGDPQNASTMNVALEAIGDRTAYMKVRTDRIEPLPNIATLAAIPAPADGLIRFVEATGLYMFDSASALPATATLVVAADDATPGRWLWAGYYHVGRARGLAYLNADAQLVVPATGAGWPAFTASRTRVRAVALQGFMISRGYDDGLRNKSVTFYSDATSDPAKNAYEAVLLNGGLKFLSSGVGGDGYGIQLCIDQFVHDGAHLAQVSARLSPASGHVALPVERPALGVFRKAKFGSALASLNSAGDFVLDPSPDVAAFEAQHSVTMAPDQHSTIETANYSYFVQFWNEYDNLSRGGLILHGIELTHDSIVDMRFA